MSRTVRCLVRRDTYRDSVELMRVAAEIEQFAGVLSAALLMGTPANCDLLAGAGLLEGEATSAGPNDLVAAVAAADGAAAEAALEQAARLLDAQPASLATSAPSASRSASSGRGSGQAWPPPRTIAGALNDPFGELRAGSSLRSGQAPPAANLAIISTPGPYATAEALKALKRGLHVFLFSDNVSIEDEIELKQLAERKGLLVMGPDCGTAILDGVPLGFANAVRRGRIGLVGASGTGLQQVSCLIDRLGEGVSQVIGVGGHDLHERVGGRMMLAGISRLAADPDTAVIVLVSKPPAAPVARRVLEVARDCSKPVVVTFLGGDPAAIRAVGAIPAATLEDAARLAVGAARGEPAEGGGRKAEGVEERLAEVAREQASRFAAGQRYVRGLYSGGTLCQEAALILNEAVSVPSLRSGQAGRRPFVVNGHTTLDLGEDEFTVGRPHPMIDARLRNEHIVAAAEDPTTAVILLDVVLGYGSHPDPAGALIPAIEWARRRAADAGRHLAVVASVCGTPADPQDLTRQEEQLAAAGVILAPSNARAARMAALIAAEITSPSARGIG